MKIKFTENPTGRFNLAYSKGETVEIDSKRGAEIVAAGYAELVEDEIPAEKPAKKTTKKTAEK